MIFSEDNFCLNCKGTGCKIKLPGRCHVDVDKVISPSCGRACIYCESYIKPGYFTCSDCGDGNKCQICQGEGFLIWIDFLVKN